MFCIINDYIKNYSIFSIQLFFIIFLLFLNPIYYEHQFVIFSLNVIVFIFSPLIIIIIILFLFLLLFYEYLGSIIKSIHSINPCVRIITLITKNNHKNIIIKIMIILIIKLMIIKKRITINII